MPAKLKWKVAEAPSGRYRSFQHRGWPSLYYGHPRDGVIAAAIYCKDSYSPARARGDLFQQVELVVRVAQWGRRTEAGVLTFDWRTLKARFATLAEAKAAAERFLDEHPDWAPPKE